MCKTANTIKFLCDYESHFPDQTHNYAKKHHLVQEWKGCDYHPDQSLRRRRFFESATREPCNNRVTVPTFKICPDCSVKYGARTERINSHVRMIIHLLQEAGGDLDSTGPLQARERMCFKVIEWRIYLDNVASAHMYNQKHPSHPPPPENNKLSEQEYYRKLDVLNSTISRKMKSERRKPGGGDKSIIRNLFCQMIRAEIEQHKIWVVMSEKYSDNEPVVI